MRKKNKFRIIRIIIGLGIFTVLTVSLVAYLFKPKSAEAVWFSDSWLYRSPINISNSSGSNLSDFQVSVTVDSDTLTAAGKLQNDCDDLRFTDPTGNLLPYWIEDSASASEAVTCNSADVTVWVRVPSVPTAGSTLYMYYGNSNAIAASNGKLTFPFFEDFGDSTLNTRIWTATGTTSISSGEIAISTGAIYMNSSLTFLPANYHFEQRVKWTDTTGNNTGLTVAEGQSINVNNIDSQMVSSLAVSSVGDYNVGAYAGDGGAASYNVVNGTNQYATSASSYHVSGMGFDSSTVKYYNNRSLTNSYTESISAFPYVFLGFLRGSGSGTVDGRNMTTDWVLSRKYASTAPSASFGTEEQGTVPVVYFKLDEGKGTTISDSISNISMSFSGAPVWKDENECVSGRCLYFDGVDDYATVSAPTLVKSASRTVSFWFKPISFAATQGIVSLASTNYYVGITTNGRLIESHQNSSNSQVTNTTANNTIKGSIWQHASIVVSSGTINYYLNGKLLESDAFADGQGSTYGSNMRIANITASFFNGYVDEVRVYNYARSANQVLGEYNSRGSDIGGSSAQVGSGGAAKGESLSDGLNTWWKMDQSSWNGTASEVVDSSGKSVNGVAQCDVAYNTCASGVPSTTASGLYGRGGSFNQDGQRLYTDAEDLATTERFESESIWIKPDTLPTSTNKMHFLVQLNAYDATASNPTVSTSTVNNLYINSSGTISFQALSYSGSTLCSNSGLGEYLNQTLTTSTAITAGTWNHVAYTINWGAGSEINIKLYLNGRLEASFNEVGRSCYSQNYHTWIGKAKDTASSFIDFDGTIDEYRRYKKILLPEEVNALYSVWTPGPVGYWNLDENTGTSAGNSANSSNNGTLTNGPTWIQGRYGNAVNFDGSDDYISATTTGLVTGSGARTLAGWIYMSANTASLKIPFAYGTCSVGSDAFGVYLDASEVLNFWGCGAGDFSTSTTLSINTWYHIAITYDATNVKVFVNGVQAGATTAKSLNTGTTGMMIGSDGTIDASSYPFQGYADDIRAYNFALSTKQVVNIMNGAMAGDSAVGSPVGHPVFYYKFDEGYGSFTYNSVNSSLLGTLSSISSPATSTSGWTDGGKVNKAIIFDNINDYVGVTDAAAISPTTGLTVSAWVKRASASSADGVIGKYNSAANRRSYLLGFNTSVVQLTLSSNGTSTSTATGTTTIAANSWYHVVGTYDGSYIRVYVNGNLEGSTAYSSGIYDSTDDLRIGDGDATFWPFNGVIDEVKLYNFALSNDEIKLDYNQSKSVVLGNLSTSSTGASDNSSSRKYCVPGDTSTCNVPVAEWNFDENTSNSINDSSGNANTGVLTNGPTWSTGKYGNSVKLDGSDDYITVSSSTSLNSGTSAVSFSTWVKPNSTSDAYVALKFATASPNGNGDYWFGISSSKWVAKTSGGTGSVSSIDNVQTGKWYHLSLVWTSGSVLNFYVNGVWQGSDAISGTISNASQPLWFGRWDTAYFNGEVDESRLFTYARTDAQVAWEYNQGLPQYYYKLDECQGSTASNTAKNGNGEANGLDGTISIGGTGSNTDTGTCTGSSGTAWKDGATGKYSASLEFDGTDDKVDTSTSASLNMTGQSFTIAAWIKTSQATTATFMMIRDGGGTAANVLGGFPINITSGKVSFDTWDYATNRVTSTQTINDGSWHHVVGVYNSATGLASLYVDGVFQASATQTGSSGNVNKLLRLGANIDTSSAITQPYSGQVDEAMLFSYPLNATQVKDVYNRGSVHFR